MVETKSETKTVRFIITRQDTPDSAPYDEEFELDIPSEYERHFRFDGNSP